MSNWSAIVTIVRTTGATNGWQ